MRSGLLVALCVLITASAAWAENIPRIRDGDLQLVFEFNGLSLLDLNTYAGGVGLRYFYYDEFAFRGSFNFAYARAEEKIQDIDTSRTWIGGTFLIEKYLEPIASIAPYLGGGFGYYWNREWHPDGVVEPSWDISTTERIIEVPLVGGLQWYFANAMSLGGEYRLALRYVNSQVKRERQEGSELLAERTYTRFGFTAVSLFLSVHIPR